MKNYKYVICGLLAGVPNGFFGAGGGMIIVPMFCKWLNMPDKKAFATSVAVIFPMSVASAIVYFLRSKLSFMVALPYLIGGLCGGIISGFAFKKVSTGLLHKALGAFIIYGGVRSLFF